MSKIVWDEVGKRFYETGTDHGVLYIPTTEGEYNTAVAWNGLTGIEENPSGAEATKLYADNINYISLYSAEEFGATVKAYTYPPEFEKCDGSATLATGVIIGQQTRTPFGLAYRTKVGNDTGGQDRGYKIHLLYGCKASPSARSYQTVNDSPEAIEFSWELSTTPVPVANHSPSATLVIDSITADEDKLKELEDILFGVDAELYDSTETYELGDYCINGTKTYKCAVEATTPGEFDEDDWVEIKYPDGRLPLPDEIAEIFAA